MKALSLRTMELQVAIVTGVEDIVTVRPGLLPTQQAERTGSHGPDILMGRHVICWSSGTKRSRPQPERGKPQLDSATPRTADPKPASTDSTACSRGIRIDPGQTSAHAYDDGRIPDLFHTHA